MSFNPFNYFTKGRKLANDPHHLDAQKKNQLEISKTPLRSDVINFLLSLYKENTCYLEIGVRNPESNFNHIKATKKYSVDPGVEFKQNPVDFRLTSDEFFKKLSAKEILSNDIRFHVIFIDGLHLAPQVDRDIQNALDYLTKDGFIVLHDCNPPTEWHARESFEYHGSPAEKKWNGTTWKAFLKWRFNPSVYSCCVDSDWGVGVLSKHYQIGKNIEPVNPFFEYSLLDRNRNEYLNLIDFETLKGLIQH